MAGSSQRNHLAGLFYFHVQVSAVARGYGTQEGKPCAAANQDVAARCQNKGVDAIYSFHSPQNIAVRGSIAANGSVPPPHDEAAGIGKDGQAIAFRRNRYNRIAASEPEPSWQGLAFALSPSAYGR